MSGRPSKYTKRETEKSKVFWSVLYPDSESYDCNAIIKEITDRSIKYAYILHSEDEFTADDPFEDVPEEKIGQKKKPHIHVLFEFDNAIQLGLVSNMIGLSSNFIQRVKNKRGALRYLVHKDNPEKHQYEICDIVNNYDNLQKKFFNDDDGIMKAQKIIEYIMSCDHYCSITQIANWSIANYCWDEFRRGQHLFTAIINEHNLDYHNKEN